jgi:GTPase SAR1 family protein
MSQQDQIPSLLEMNRELFPGTEEFGLGKKADSYKILIVGDSGIGKTCLMNKVLERKFQDHHYPTRGVS